MRKVVKALKAAKDQRVLVEESKGRGREVLKLPRVAPPEATRIPNTGKDGVEIGSDVGGVEVGKCAR